MAATLRASTKGLAIVDKARRKKNWTKTSEVWFGLAHTSPSTLRRFWSGIAIQAGAFQSICQCVGIEDWKSIVDDGAMAVSCLEKNPTFKKRKQLLIFELDADFEGIDPQKLHAVIAQLSEMGNPVMRFVDVEEGSIKLLFEGSQEDFERVKTLFNTGELRELIGLPVKSIHVMKKEELVHWIQKNGGANFPLSNTNLSNANLSNANLSNANLIHVDLSGAYLIHIDLRDANLFIANLSGANLSNADLSGANLSGANLSNADLSLADLSGASLSYADLSGADLRRANLSVAFLTDAIVRKALFGIGIGLSNEQKQDLIARGAIFDDGSRDRESSLVPVPSGRR
jgi:hypothetical protein